MISSRQGRLVNMTVMATPLSNEQQQDLRQHGNQPVPVVDPDTNAVYFLVTGELFERFKALLTEEPFNVTETYAAQDVALAKVWDDPALDIYNDFDSHPQP